MNQHPSCKKPESNSLRPDWSKRDCEECPRGPYRSPGCLFWRERLEVDFELVDYSDESLVEAVVAVWLAAGRPPTRADFEGHKGKLPSYTTLRKRLGGLQAARELALARLVERGLVNSVDTTLPKRGRKRGH